MLVLSTSIFTAARPSGSVSSAAFLVHLQTLLDITNSIDLPSISNVFTVTMSEKFLDAVKARRSVYALKSESTIPNSKIEEIVQAAVLHAPSTYNVQSARAVVVFKEQHVKVWEIVKGYMEGALAEHPMKDYIFNRIDGFKGSYGTVLWFEDQAALDALGEKNPMITPMLTECTEYPSGGARDEFADRF